ncbi:FkbM family methyltransferase [Alistipes dispar]|uniref:FkbM family methyltransferase n=1 Tax=Alistipes dispar TaxID=2585119 RepID=UPI003BF1D75A
MKKTLHRILYRTLPLEGYLRAVSRLFFLWQRLGLGRRAPETEYVYHLPQLVRAGDTCIDIGANLGYYARTISRLAGPAGRVYAVEPVAPIRKVLSRNLRRCGNTEILPFALGAAAGPIRMGNDSARENGYFGTGRNFVNEGGGRSDVEFTAEMRRGSELFARLPRLDFIKCDIEGYEAVVMEEMRPLLERFRPTVLIETGGENRPRIVRLFTRLGYAGYTLDRGREIPLSPGSTKDIIFRPGAERPEGR